MSNIFRQHREKVLAAQSAQASVDQPYRDATQYELMLGQLAQHKRALKQIKSRDAKVARKVEFLPEYAGYLAGVLEADTGVQDDVLTTVMLWAIDVGDFDLALTLAEYALKHKLATPDHYNRDLVDLLVEEIAEVVIAQHDQDNVPVAVLETVRDLTTGSDMYDEVRAKLHKGLGLVYAQRKETVSAIKELESALQYNERCGVKKLCDRLKREQAKVQAADKATTTITTTVDVSNDPERKQRTRRKRQPLVDVSNDPTSKADHDG